VLTDGQDAPPGVCGTPDGDDAVVGTCRQIDDHRIRSGKRLAEGSDRPDGRAIRAGGADLVDEACRPDEVVGKDEDACHAREPGLSRASR
jgi:hypothetical protein